VAAVRTHPPCRTEVLHAPATGRNSNVGLHYRAATAEGALTSLFASTAFSPSLAHSLSLSGVYRISFACSQLFSLFSDAQYVTLSLFLQSIVEECLLPFSWNFCLSVFSLKTLRLQKRNFTSCTLHQILVGWSSQRGWDRRGM